MHASCCFNRVNATWSAGARRGGLARQFCCGVCVPGTRVHPACPTCAAGHRGKPRGSKERPVGRVLLRERYMYIEPVRIRKVWETTEGAWLHLAGSQLTVMVAPNNVSGFVPPMDLPPYQHAVSYERSCRSVKAARSSCPLYDESSSIVSFWKFWKKCQ